MSYMPIPFKRPAKNKDVLSDSQYPSVWSILDVASSAKFKLERSSSHEGYLVDLITPDNDIRVRNLKRNCAYRRIGLYPSAKNDKMIYCESFIERNFAHFLEFHPEVISYKEQPCIIKWVDLDGVSRTHIPDFRIEFRNGNKMIVEIKPDDAVNDPEIVQRTQILGREIAAKYGYKYILVLESQLDEQVLLNADIIRKFQMDNIPSYDYEEMRRVFENAGASLSIADLENMSCEAISIVNNLIRRGVVIFDMTTPLNRQTPLTWREGGQA